MRISDWSSDVCSSDLWRGVVPGSVSKVSVGGNAVDFDTQLLEFSVVVGQVFQLGWANEGEVGRVEEHHGPLAFQVGVRNLAEFAVFESGSVERFNLAVDDRRSEEHTYELQSLMRRSYAVF